MRARPRVERALAVVGAATLLIVGFDTLTYASTGSSLLLGRINTANRTTTITNTGSGAALRLVTSTTAAAPFTTNARGRVPNLYADKAANSLKLAGLTVTQVKTAAHSTFATVATDPAGNHLGNTTFTVGKLPTGSYLATLSGHVMLTEGGNLGGTPPTANYIHCELSRPGAVLADGTGDAVSDVDAYPTFSRVITVTSTQVLSLACWTRTADGWVAYPDSRLAVSFVSLDGLALRNLE